MRILLSKAINEKDNDGKITVMTYVEASGSSSEEKPVRNILDGSIFVESDTGKVFFFNEAQQTWIEQFSFQG